MKRALVGLLLLWGCDWFEPVLDPLTTDPMVVQVDAAWQIATDARQPTDLVAGPRGLTVLDGYQRRLLRYGADRTFEETVPLGHLPLRAARIAPVADSDDLWVTAPGSPDAVRIDASGAVRATLTVRRDDGPVAGLADLVDRGVDLVVALADGPLARVDRATGLVLQEQAVDVDGERLGASVHLSSDGRSLLLTETLGAEIHRFDADLVPIGRAGRHGMWIGTLGKPKAAVTGPGGVVIVADSEHGAVQVFAEGGRPLGALALDGRPLRLEHPIALALVGDELAVLDSATATVHGLRLSRTAVDDAAAAVQLWRHLRTDLVSVPHEERLADGSLCRQCHDGTLLDHRQNWDPALHHHPVNVAPAHGVPDFFPLDDEGRLRCTTCHSPHGTVGVADATGDTPRADLIRHAPTEGDQFTRLSRGDAALCVACHTEAAHERALDTMAVQGSAHPTGAALARALEARGKGIAGLPGDVGDSCLTCHDVHGAERRPLLRSSSSAEVCAACHAAQARPGRNHPLRGESLAQGCRSCHDLVAGTTSALVSTSCASCHAPLRGAHAKVRGSCAGCHDVHDAPAGAHLVATRTRTVAADPAGCRSCHAGHQGDVGHPVTADVGCQTCHDAHRPAATPACGSCHAAPAAAAARGGHGRATCRDCHPAHGAAPSFAAAGVNPRSGTCLACHAPGTASGAQKVPAWDHPAPVFTPEGLRWTPLGALPLFDAGGQPVSSAANGELTCSTCHTTHGPPASGGELLRPDVVGACASCHGDDARALYRSFHKGSRR